jgi:hypothetical protein
MKLNAYILTLATAATLVLATQQVSAQGYYERQEQDRQSMARDTQRYNTDRGREEFERKKFVADKNAEAAAEKRGDWKAAKNLAKWEDYRAKQYWNDRNKAGRDVARYRRDRGTCKRDGGC